MSLRLPHTFVLLFLMVLAAAAASRVLPAGEYGRVEVGGRKLVDPSSFQAVEPRPAGLGEVCLAFPRGLIEAAPIVFYIFLIGGAFAVVNASGAVEAAIAWVVAACGGHGPAVIPLLMLLFSLGGATIGLAEETLAFLPALVALSRRLGYDEVVGGAIALVGAGAGFAGAFMNPFTVGVAQGIAGLPLLSGMAYRIFVWAALTALTIAYVSAYARRIRRVPDPAGAAASAPPLTTAQGRVLALVGLALGLLVLGSLRWGWGILELAGLFTALTVLAGPAGGLGPDETAEKFIAGAAAMTSGALVVGLARGVLVILDGSRVTDSILHALAGAVHGLPSWASVVGIYAMEVALSYIVPSGSGQAALTIPILAPLADLVGVTRQTMVLAYQFGDGFSNVFAPTVGYFMAGLALIGVPWTRWLRFMWPLQLLWLGAGLGFLLLAHAAGWGPF